ncbi:hypothetical protein E0K89_018630 [Aquicoccus sp. SCR17]|nr:hypothetical protein [Carideicomes alvinocaridis]
MRFAAIVLLLAALLIGGYVWYGAREAEEVTVNDGTDEPPSEIDVPTAEGVGNLPDEEGNGAAPGETEDAQSPDAGEGPEAGEAQVDEAGDDQALEAGDAQASEAGGGDAQGADTDASGADGAAIPEEELDRLLTVEGFDFDRAMTVLEQADLSDPVKMATRSELESARDEPELLQTVLDDLRERLGLPATRD